MSDTPAKETEEEVEIDLKSTKQALWYIVIGVLVVIGLIVLAKWLNKEAPARRAGAELEAKEKPAAQTVPDVYFTNLIVTDVPARAYTRDCYKMEAKWGVAPLETRTNVDTNFVPIAKMPIHTEGGDLVKWREWRVAPGYSPPYAKVEIRYTRVRDW